MKYRHSLCLCFIITYTNLNQSLLYILNFYNLNRFKLTGLLTQGLSPASALILAAATHGLFKTGGLGLHAVSPSPINTTNNKFFTLILPI